MTRDSWTEVNQNLIAKSIGELSFEEIVRPIFTAQRADTHLQEFALHFESGAIYRFSAWKTAWDFLRVDPRSVVRKKNDRENHHLEAGQFFIDAQKELGLSDITLGHFLEEMHSTLYADLAAHEKFLRVSSAEMSGWTGDEIQRVLQGHPKVLLNKGRLGWGVGDHAFYAPESARPFKLRWAAVHRDLSIVSLDFDQAADSTALRAEKESLNRQMTARNLDPDDYVFLMVHPWQWDRVVSLLFVGAVAQGQIIDLGLTAEEFLPQISLRTLTNATDPKKNDVKLPLSILNTSAVRGLPSRYVKFGVQISGALARLCRTDAILRESGTDVLRETEGISVRHPLFEQIERAPYRYNETLGMILRESVYEKLKDGETSLLTGSLFHQDGEGKSLIGAIVKKSGLTVEAWLRLYFEKVVVPLYHLQVHYGLGLVAHGQNIVLKMKDHRPAGILLKDFQGDLRVHAPLTSKFADLEVLVENLESLPADHLIHDLITGHFISVLRFVSAVLQESDHFSESEFYATLSDVLANYLVVHRPGMVDSPLNLVRATFERVLLNKVRFKIGYADLSERPRPMVGSLLDNPLFRFREAGLSRAT